MKKFEGKIAVVTGASRLDGIGAAICLELAELGCSIFYTYWTGYDHEMDWGKQTSQPEELRSQLLSLDVKVASMELDFGEANFSKKLFDEVQATLGEPDFLIHNAAYSTNTDFRTLTALELNKHYQVNIAAPTLLSAEFARRFTKTTGGRIVSMTSGQFQGPMPGELAYATTKGALDALTITLASEVAPLGITVNAINPGPTDTGWMTPEIREHLSERFPFGRVGLPKDAAKTVTFLVSEEAGWITGQILHAEGGFRR